MLMYCWKLRLFAANNGTGGANQIMIGLESRSCATEAMRVKGQ